MKKAAIALAVLATAALVAPLAAQGYQHKDDALRVRVELPLVFSDPMPGSCCAPTPSGAPAP
jgi:hypothetical protein